MNIRIITFTRVGCINYSLIAGIYCVNHYIFVAMVMCAPRDRLHAMIATIAIDAYVVSMMEATLSASYNTKDNATK